MAKTLTSGVFSSNQKTTIYTAPSDKYAYVTVIYFHTGYQNTGNESQYYQTWSSSMSCYLGIDHNAIVSYPCPYFGTLATSNSSYSHHSKGNTSFIVPPSSTVKAYLNGGTYNNSILKYMILIEEVAKTTVEA